MIEAAPRMRTGLWIRRWVVSGLLGWIAFLVGLPGLALDPVWVAKWPDGPRLGTIRSAFVAPNFRNTGRNYALIAAGVSGVHLRDVTNPAEEQTLAVIDTPGSAEAVVATAELAVIADGIGGVMVVNITQPAAPRLVGSVEFQGNTADVALFGNHALVVNRSGSLHVIQVSPRNAPVLVGTLPTRGEMGTVRVADQRAYLAGVEGLQVIDLRDPARPRELAFFPTRFPVNDLAVSRLSSAQVFAYLVDGAAGVSVVDVTAVSAVKPARLLGQATVDGPAWGIALAASGNLVWVANGVGGLRCVDVSDPAKPRLLDPSLPTGGDARRVTVTGTTLYVTDRKAGLRIVDGSEPDLLGAAFLLGTVRLSGRALGVAATDSWLCLADGVEGLRLFDIRQPRFLINRGHVPPEAGASTMAVAVGNRRLAAAEVADTWAGVRIFDRPAGDGGQSGLVRRGFFRADDRSYRISGVAMTGDWVLAAAGPAGLVVVDAAEADRPVFQRRVPLDGSAVSVAVEGGHAYVATLGQGLQVVDVRNPGEARWVGGTGVPAAGWRAVGVAVRGDRAFLAAENRGLQVVDISDPTRPRILGNGVETSGVAVDVAVRGELGFIADGEAGLSVLNLATPAAPRFQGRFDTEGEARALVVANEHLFVADDSRLLAFAVPGLTPASNSPPSFVISSDSLSVEEDVGLVVVPEWLRDVRPGGFVSEQWQSVTAEISAVEGNALFAESPGLDAQGTLRFRVLPEAFGTARLILRVRDDGGTLFGGRDVTAQEFLIRIRPINDPPTLDPQSELAWRLEGGDLVALVTGIRAGPDNEQIVQRVTLRAKSKRPDLLPDPVVEYPGGNEARLRFPGRTQGVGAAEVGLWLELVDDGGTADGGRDRTEAERILQIQPPSGPPRLTVIEPADGAILPPGTTSVMVRVRTEDEAGPLRLLAFSPSQGLPRWVQPQATEVFWEWELPTPGLHFLGLQGFDQEGLPANGVALGVVVSTPPALRSSAASLDFLEDSTAASITLTAQAGIPGPPKPMVPVVRSSDPTLIADSGIRLESRGGGWLLWLSPVSNAVGTLTLQAVVTGGAGLTATNQIQVRILPLDDPPLVALEEPAEGAVFSGGAPIRWVAAASDVDGPLGSVDFYVDDRLIGSVVEPPYAGLWANPGAGRHLLTAVARGVAADSLSVTSAPVRIEVILSTNRAPTVAGEGGVTVYRDASSAPVLLVIDDDRTPLGELGVRVESMTPELLPGTNLVLGGEGGLRTLVITPAGGRIGAGEVRVTVTDAEGLSGSLTFPVTVLPVNALPGGEGCFADTVPEGYGTFNVLKLGRYRQELTSGDRPVSEGATTAIELRAPPRYTILNSAVSGPSGFRVSLDRRDDGLFTWSEAGEEEPVTGRLPFGSWNTTYRLSLVPGESFTGFFPFVVVSNVPPVPEILDSAAARSVSADVPFTLSWVPWTGAGTNDRVVLNVMGPSGEAIFTAASDCSGQTLLGRRAGSIEIPAGRLKPGSAYTGFLTFGATQLAVNDRSPLLMLRAYHTRTTRFRLETLPEGRAAPAVFVSTRWLGGRLVVALRGSPGVSYRLQSSMDLVAWEGVEERVVPPGGTVEVLLPAGPEPRAFRFYRAVAGSVRALP